MSAKLQRTQAALERELQEARAQLHPALAEAEVSRRQLQDELAAERQAHMDREAALRAELEGRAAEIGPSQAEAEVEVMARQAQHLQMELEAARGEAAEASRHSCEIADARAQLQLAAAELQAERRQAAQALESFEAQQRSRCEREASLLADLSQATLAAEAASE